MENLKQILDLKTLFDEIVKIGKKHDLHIDQIGGLDSEVRALCLGAKKKEDFVKNISEHLEISLELAKELAEDVNVNILLKIRELIQNNNFSEPLAPTLETPDEILKHIEDGGLELPAPEIVPELAPTPVPSQPTPDLTEHLLQNTVASPHVEETKVEKKYTVDPYREPIA